jgi:cell division cycle protein 37
VESFALKIKERAVEKRKEQLGRAGQQGPELPRFKEGDTEYQVLSKAERMGPGGLDPLEVLETLPPPMKEAFMSQDIPALHKILETMKYEEAKYHMDRCRKSGLWVSEEDPEGDGTDNGGSGSAKKEPESSSSEYVLQHVTAHP